MDQQTTQSFDLALIVGETSGDVHASDVIQHLLQQNPDLKICAVSGPRMRTFPIHTFFPMEKLQVMGFIDILFSLPKLIFAFFRIRNYLLKCNPKQILFVDYPGMNLRLARSLKKKGFKGKISHYICPTVWAWGKKRIPLMEKNLDGLFTILPFETKCFDASKLKAKYVGNPLIQHRSSFKNTSAFTLGIFPGSRKKELQRNLPVFLEVAKKLKKEFTELQILVSCSKKEFFPLIEKMTQSYNYTIVQDSLFTCALALATSGTVILELALQKIPTIVGYAIHSFDYFLATKIFKINLPFYSLPNLIAQQEIFPECYGPHFTEGHIYTFAQKILENSSLRTKMQMKCEKLKKILGNQNAGQEVAQTLLETNS